MGQGNQALMPTKLAYVRILFHDAVERCLNNEYVDYPPVTAHITEALYRSMRSRDFFLYDSTGQMLDTPADMINHANRMREAGDAATEYQVRISTGDYTMLMLGMFPQCREVVSVGPALFSECGRRSYDRANEIENDVFGQATDTFEAMADFFPRSPSCRHGSRPQSRVLGDGEI